MTDRKEYQHRYYLEHKNDESIILSKKKSQRRCYMIHRDKILAYQRKYYQEHREKMVEYMRNRYSKIKEERESLKIKKDIDNV